MSSKPLLSVIIPVYNVERYLITCLDSVINQTFKDIEIICVNDGSTDNSLNILKRYEKTDDRIVIVEKTNGGLSSARNAGIDIAKGEYVCFLDSDDYYETNACERLIEVIKKSKPDIIVFGANIFPNKPKPSLWLKNVLTTRDYVYEPFTPEALFTEPGCRPFVWRDCFNLRFINENSLRFEESVFLGEDQVFQFVAFPRAESIVFIKDKLYNYRWIRKDSLMSQYCRKNEIRFQQHVKITELIFKHWSESGDMKAMPVYLLRWALNFLGSDYMALPPSKKKVYSETILRLLDSLSPAKYRASLNGKQKDILDSIRGDNSVLIKVLIGFRYIFRAVIAVFRSLKNNGLKNTIKIIFARLNGGHSA